MTQQMFQQQGFQQPQQGWPQQQGFQPQQGIPVNHHAHPSVGGAVTQSWAQDPAPARDLGNSFNLAGNNGNAFPFETIGDTVTGTIISMEEQQQTDMQTGMPKTFDNGQPMMMYKVRLQTGLRDPSNPVDDGSRSVYLRGSVKPESQSSLSAVIAAVQQATGSTNLQTGGTLTLTYIGNGQARQRGYNAPKLYAAQYQAPSVNLAPVQQTPVQQQYVQQPQQLVAANPTQALQQQTPAPVQQAAIQQAAIQQAAIQQAAIQPSGLSPEMLQAMANMQNAGLTNGIPNSDEPPF